MTLEIFADAVNTWKEFGCWTEEGGGWGSSIQDNGTQLDVRKQILWVHVSGVWEGKYSNGMRV